MDRKNLKQRATSALALTRELIEKHGPRLAGSEASRACARDLADHVRDVADDVRLESFPVHPGAFLGWIRVLVVIYAVATVFLWFGAPLPAAILVTAGLGIMIAEFFLYAEVLDLFYPSETGTNVLASIEPSGEVTGELIVSGHHDSARVFNFLVHQPALYPVRVYGGIGSLLLLFVASCVLTVQALAGGQVLVRAPEGAATGE